MDVMEIYRNLDGDGQRALEKVLLRSVRRSLDATRNMIAEYEDEEGQTEAQKKENEEEIEWWDQQRMDLLFIVIAMAGSGGESDPEQLIDGAAIERVIRDRRQRQETTISKSAATAASRKIVALNPNRRRPGRPTIYRWQDFAAEMARRCGEGPVPDQATLERHMQQWCTDNWGGEPSQSQIRDWVGPTFKATQIPALSGQADK